MIHTDGRPTIARRESDQPAPFNWRKAALDAIERSTPTDATYWSGLRILLQEDDVLDLEYSGLRDEIDTAERRHRP